MVSIMDEVLELEMGHKVLEVGAGSGWHAATIAEIVAPTDAPKDKWGHVYTVEIVSQLKPLVEQLKTGGVLVIPVGGMYLYQTLVRVRKRDGQILEENLGGVAFVPLTGKYGQRL